MKWLRFLCYNNLCTNTDTGDKIQYCRLPKNTEIQQQNTIENNS